MEGRKETELTSSEYNYVMFLPWPILGAFFLERGGGGGGGGVEGVGACFSYFTASTQTFNWPIYLSKLF